MGLKFQKKKNVKSLILARLILTQYNCFSFNQDQPVRNMFLLYGDEDKSN